MEPAKSEYPTGKYSPRNSQIPYSPVPNCAGYHINSRLILFEYINADDPHLATGAQFILPVPLRYQA